MRLSMGAREKDKLVQRRGKWEGRKQKAFSSGGSCQCGVGCLESMDGAVEEREETE